MTDAELLVRAAKAAGVTHPEVLRKHFASGWNPLVDDGDALRLAVKLGMHLAVDHEDKETLAVWYRGVLHTEAFNGDPCAATRRAIVRVAAAIA